MLFNSLTFVVFFAVVVSAYWMMDSWRGRKNLLLIASYIFYGAWNPPFAALLFSTTALDFYLGRRIAKEQRPGPRNVWLVISVAVNLSMLGFFKYGNFLLENFQWALARGGITYQPPHLDVFLPIGISFYTFHSLSYTLDIYRGVMQPTRSLRASLSPSRFSRSWSRGQSCAPAISFRNWKRHRNHRRAVSCGGCC